MKIGLKVHSTNDGYIKAAGPLCAGRRIHYIEVYIVPGLHGDVVRRWGDLGVPLGFHAPHCSSGFNPSLPDHADTNRAIAEALEILCVEMQPLYVVFHPGVNGTIAETIRQLKSLFGSFPGLGAAACIENLPQAGLRGETCLGSTPDEISRILGETGMGFCLDAGHALCSAAARGESWEEMLERFRSLDPSVVHLSDGHVTSPLDEHLHLGAGDYDFPHMLDFLPERAYLTIETEKSSKIDLDDFIEDLSFFERLRRAGGRTP